jgi:predicted transcriptional regulator
VGAPLGALETAIMRHVWACGDAGCLAADVQQALETEQSAALTTVLTTLDRLLHKGIVRREREGKAYRYRAAITEQELEQRIVNGVLDNLIARFPKAVATYFSETGGASANLSDLARLVEELQRRNTEVEQEVEKDD